MDMSLKTTSWRLAGLMLCAAVFAGTALAADNGAPGRSGEAPGQEKKDEQAAQTTQPGNSENAPGQEQKAEVQARIELRVEAKADTAAGVKTGASAEAKAGSRGRQKRAVQQQAKVEQKIAHAAARAAKSEHAAKADEARGPSALALHHVIVCHRTGSDSNPYVVINIPLTAWTHAHSDTTGAHPDLNGRHDILLKDPASRPGSKDGFSKSACESGVTATAAATTTEAATRSLPAGATVTTASQPGTARGAVAGGGSSPGASALAGAVAPAQAARGEQGEQAEESAGGVLGATAQAPQSLGRTAVTGTLPFTGIPIWVAALLGAALLSAGLMVRRSA
jgi:hypothetical protein